MHFGRPTPYLLLAILLVLLGSLAKAAGRLAPRAALAPLLFLITRRAVLVAWAIGAAAMLLLLLPAALAHGHDSLSDLLELAGLSLFCGLGAAVPLVGVPFFLVRAFTRPPALELEPGERVLRESLANHFLAGEARGGRLVVTTRRVGFKSHRFNVQLTPWSVRLDDVRSLEASGARFLVVGVAGSGAQAKQDWLVVTGARELADYLRELSKTSEADRSSVGGGGR